MITMPLPPTRFNAPSFAIVRWIAPLHWGERGKSERVAEGKIEPVK